MAWKGENLGAVDWYTSAGEWPGSALAQDASVPERVTLWSQQVKGASFRVQ